MKEMITVLKKILLENKYLNPTADENKMKFFLPKFLTTIDQSDNNLSNTLAKIGALIVKNNERMLVNI